MKDMKHLDREAERRNIKSDNDTFILIIIGVTFLVCLLFSPIGFISGFLLSKESKDRDRTFVIGLGLVIVGIIISFVYAISMPIAIQIDNFFYNYYEIFRGKESVIKFIIDYILNPYWVVACGLALLAGMITYFHFTTDTRDFLKNKRHYIVRNNIGANC